MKTFRALGVLIILVCPSLFARVRGPAVATITEVEGLVEIQCARGWEQLPALLPLAAGDMIRVTKPGKAILLYLRGALEVITESNSPYLIRKTTPGKSQSEKAAQKLFELFRGLFARETARKVNLLVREAIDSNKDIQPDNTGILFSNDPIVFQWRGSQPPYVVVVCRHEKGKELEPLFYANTNDTSQEFPIDKFQPEATYEWIIATGAEQWNANFTLKSKAETQSLLNELSVFLEMIPIFYPVTRAVVQSEFFVENELYYDAYRFLEKSLSRFPGSEALHRLFARFNSD